jgi:hypothetical protein
VAAGRRFVGEGIADKVLAEDTHRARATQKLGVEDLPTLVKFAIRHGMTTLE